MEHGLQPADDERVSRVVATLEAHHALGVVGQPVHDLALAFVTPLRADDDYVFCHKFNSSSCGFRHARVPGAPSGASLAVAPFRVSTCPPGARACDRMRARRILEAVREARRGPACPAHAGPRYAFAAPRPAAHTARARRALLSRA